MNDFVMSVVNEVLCKPESNTTASSFCKKEGIELERPNYQRNKAKKRLMVYDIPSKQNQEQEGKQHQLSTFLLNNMAVRSNEMSSESLHKRKSEASKDRSRNFIKPEVQENPYKDFMNPEFSCNRNSDFSNFLLCNNNLRRLVGFPYSNQEAACMGEQESCFINQLFTVDEILRQFPALDFNIKWSPYEKEPFIFKAVGTMSMMKTVQELLNQYCINKREIRIIKQPTVYLKKVLNLSAETIGTIEGVHYAKLIPQIADYLMQHTNSLVECNILGSYLLLSGPLTEVQEILEKHRMV